MSYQGWLNYETWAAYSWIANDEKLYNYCRDVAISDESLPVKMALIEARLDEEFPCLLPLGLPSDILSHALSEISWREVVRGLQDVIETYDEEGDLIC